MISEKDQDAVLNRYRLGNALLFTPESEFLALLMGQLKIQGKRGVVLWALECAEEACSRFEQIAGNQPVPRDTVSLCRSWARGKVTMITARPAILACHALAKDLQDAECIALVHAVAQACSTVHAKDHARAFPLYRLTAMMHQGEGAASWDMVESMVEYMQERLEFWRLHADDANLSWSDSLATSDPVTGTRGRA
ncbi:MAG: hypothetical protein JXK93_07965 [Sphaerochaetaceae bacterium]|nr:hypothetical protein [Sphaerochaetaceae bacterium]